MRISILTLGLAVCLAASSAIADTNFTGSISTDWSVAGNWDNGVPDATVTANINGAVTADVTAGTAYGVYVGSGATLNANDLAVAGTQGRLYIGNGGSGTTYATLGGTISVAGGIYNPVEGETHSLDIGGGSNAIVTIEPNSLITTAYDIGFGKDDRWQADYAVNIEVGAGTQINPAAAGASWLTFGLGGADQTITLRDGVYIGSTWFQVGGTLEIDGSVYAHGSRFRSTSVSDGSLTILKPLSDGSVFNTSGYQFWGVKVDVSELTPTYYSDWTTLTKIPTAGGWTTTNQNIAFLPGSHSDWQMRFVNDTISGRQVQIMFVPEPATMLLLGFGGIGALLRKRR